jgi:radical SAM superfamily enzyme YgiQ (UPF0313 family)
MRKNIIILFNPYRKVLSGALLAISGSLKQSGYHVVILNDLKILKKFLKKCGNDVLFAGITCLTGQSIKIVLSASEIIKKFDPTIPVVLGGYHPSLMPEQTLSDRRVDIVVIGHGERTVVELADALKDKRPISNIRGLAYKNDGKIKINEPREFEDINNFPPLDYDSVNVKNYLEDGLIPYFSSRGCPHRCAFCTVQRVYGQKWYGYTPERVVNEISHLLNKYKPKGIIFSDDNVFVDRDRVERICDLIIERGLKFKWVINSCRVNYFVNFSDEFLKKLKSAGCYSIGFGAESGSQKVLDYIKKDITVEQIIETVKKCKEYEIKCVLTFMIGLPNETKEDVLKTLDLIDELQKINPDVISAIYTYVPYPGTNLYEECVKLGLKPKESFEKWGDYNWGISQKSMWGKKEDTSYLDVIVHIASFVFRNPNDFKFPINYIYRILRYFAILRWRKRAFKYAYEWKLVSWLKNKVKNIGISYRRE